MNRFLYLFDLHVVFFEGFDEELFKDVVALVGVLLLHQLRLLDHREVDLFLHYKPAMIII